MSLPQRFIARCYDPTGRWSGRLRAALDSALWRIVCVESVEKLLAVDGSAGASPSQIDSPPALLLCVLDEESAAHTARWWSTQRHLAHSRSPLVVVASPSDDAGLVTYWQELGAAAVLTTTLELPLVLQLAQRFAANPANLAADVEHPLTPFWQALPWSDALPKAGSAS
jgi:hypothetical protein